ncbi:hypothetical protein EV426DRAFT_596852 [Tirmania nivea]|nr:hypothetical protein EV426DRAFT_596852 [Tirmania nivea]
MELRSNIPRARATTSTVIQRPPIARARESFPAKLIVPNIPTQLYVPSVNLIPPPALYTYLRDTSTYIDHHDTDGPGSLDSHVYTPAHHSRHLSVSSYATQYTQRTQSTLQVIPTRTASTKEYRYEKAGFVGSTGRGGRTSTPIQLFNSSLRRSSTPGGDNHDKIDADDYQELDPKVTVTPSGFQYAATPSVGDAVSSRDLQVPLSVRRMQPSPVPTSGEKRCMRIRIVGGIKFFEELARRFKILLQAGRNLGEWKSMRPNGSKKQNSRADIGGINLYTDRGKVGAIPTAQAKHCQMIYGHKFSWGLGAKTLRIKNNATGSCVFMVTTTPGNPHEIIEVPLSLKYLQTQLFFHSETLTLALEDWNAHFRNPPPHWIINFVPKAYLRRGWHLAEEVAKYLRTYGLNAGVDSNGGQCSAWKVEYEAMGHKACLVDEGGKPCTSEGYRTGKNPSQNLLVWGNEARERHPSRYWERKEGWEGCKGLVIGLAL